MEESKKRLLVITGNLPYPIKLGIDTRVTGLLKSFSRRFEVHLVCKVGLRDYFNYVPQAKKYCTYVSASLAPNRKSNLHRLAYKIFFYLSFLLKGTPAELYYNNLSGIKNRILKLIRNNHYDILFFEYWHWEKELIQACKGLKVVDTNDVQFLRLSQIGEKKSVIITKPFTRFQMNRYKKMELEHLHLFDLIVCTSEEDKKTFYKYLSPQKEIVIFPTGTDTEYFSPRKREIGEDIVVFYGVMDGFMNIDAALYLYREIMPLIWDKKRDVKLMVVGNNPSEEIRALNSDPRINVTGYVKDVREYLSMGKVVVLPLRISYGHRGRIFEVMAMGIPLVVTPQAIKGMEIKNGEGVIIEESPLSIAQGVLNILDKRLYAEQLGMKGRKVAGERFSPQATYDRLTDFLVEYSKKDRSEIK